MFFSRGAAAAAPPKEKEKEALKKGAAANLKRGTVAQTDRFISGRFIFFFCVCVFLLFFEVI